MIESYACILTIFERIISSKMARIIYFGQRYGATLYQFATHPIYLIMPKTGDFCQITGIYRFSGHTDGSIGCHPILEEREIIRWRGETFPATKSCKKSTNWDLLEKHKVL
jgi:hypothetical protein